MTVTINGTSGITTPGLSASGTNTFATTIGVGGATPSASGAGITFPATQSASTDANTLDDYEEGTWTPSANNITTSGTVTYAGYYTKIGQVVYITLHISLASGATFSSTANTSYFSGLPFSVGNGQRNTTITASGNSIGNYGVGELYYTNLIYVPTISVSSGVQAVNMSGFYFIT